jgi:predicted amidohydrolase
MKIGIYQMKPVFGKKEINLKKVQAAISTANCDLVLLPELFSTGYSFKDKDELAYYAEPVPEGSTVQFLSMLAASTQCYIAGSIVEKSGDGLYNAAILVGPNGFIAQYRKLHLFYKEKLIFTPGDLQVAVHEIHGVKVGMIICFDWIFPELWRTLALKGAQIILHPSNLVTYWAQDATRIRSVENRIFTVLANRVGIEKRTGETIKFTGKSQVVSPKGEVVLSFSKNKEQFLVVDIDPAMAHDKYYTSLNHVLNDRRPEFYDL